MELKVGDKVRVYCDPSRTEEGGFLDGWERFEVSRISREDMGLVHELAWIAPENPDVEPEVCVALLEDETWECWDSSDYGFDPVPCKVEKED